MNGVLYILIASTSAILAVVFFVLDSRKCRRERYTEKYGWKSSSIWHLFALICAVVAYAMFYPLFHATT